jgi:hypothetical protein
MATIINDCINGLSVEINGQCETLDSIMNQTPVLDCDQLMVCIGPSFISIESLVLELFYFTKEQAKLSDERYLDALMKYQEFNKYFTKCCDTMGSRLYNIEKILMSMTGKKIAEMLPSPPAQNPLRVTNEWTTDQSLMRGYLAQDIKNEKFLRDWEIPNIKLESNQLLVGSSLVTTNEFIYFMQDDNSMKRKILAKKSPYLKGSVDDKVFKANVRKEFIRFGAEYQ